MKSSEPTPFERFDTLTRTVMAVPKSEIDRRSGIARKEKRGHKKGRDRTA